MWAERKSRGRYRSLEMKLFRCPTGTPLDTRLTTNNGVVCVTPVYPVQTVLTFVKSGTEKNKRILPETMEVKRIPIEMDIPVECNSEGSKGHLGIRGRR